jgi:hypothetical protein
MITMTCKTCKQDITIGTNYAEVNGVDIDYDVERGHTDTCKDQNRERIIYERWKQKQQLKEYEVIVTYRVYALDEEGAKEQALQQTEPDQTEVYLVRNPAEVERLENLLTPAF